LRAKPARSKSLLPFAGGLAGILLGALCLPAIASTGVAVDPPEAETDLKEPALAAPSLALDAPERAASTTVDMDDEIVASGSQSPASPARLSSNGQIALQQLLDETEEIEMFSPISEQPAAESTQTGEADGVPPTATRLPGVSESDMPRFRRQMYRTDI
jgi:hypothetical protein